MIKVTLKNGSIQEFRSGITIKEVAESTGAGVAKVVLAGEVDGKVKDCTLNLLTFDDEGGKNTYRHTASHVLAQAAKRVFPFVKLAIGPAIQNGF